MASLAGLGGFMALSSGTSFVIGVLAPHLTRDAGLSVAQIGFLTAGLYGTGSLLSPRAGRLTDRLGIVTSLLVAVTCIAFGFTLFAFAPGIWVMFVAVFVTGIALAISNPVTNRFIVQAFEPGHRGVALGAKQAGVPFAAMLAGAALPAVAAAWGWRASLGVVAIVSLGVGGLCIGVLGAGPPRTPAASGRPTPRTPKAGAVEHLTLLNPLGFLMGFCTACVGTYLVLYAVAALGYSNHRAGLLLTLVGLTGALARVIWAFLAERGAGFRPWFRTMTAMAMTAMGLTLAAQHLAAWLIWPGALLIGMSLFVYTALGTLALLTEVPQDRVGVATGAFFKAFIGGLLVGPLTFGSIADVTGGYAVSWLLVVLLMIAGFALTWWPSFLNVPRGATPDAPRRQADR